MNINNEYLKKVKNGAGEDRISYKDLILLYEKLNKPKAKLVKIENKIFISFSTNIKAHFEIYDENRIEKFNFLEDVQRIDADISKENFFKFFVKEVFQGKGVLERIRRVSEFLVPVALFNIFILLYASFATIRETFIGLLASVSIFVAIFTLFTVNHDYWERKKLILFEKGKLSYYFSVDQNMTLAGLFAIVFSLIGILITPESGNISESPVSYQELFSAVFLNVSFVFTFILLRSVYEFYVRRPGKFILGDMKKESLTTFSKPL